MIILKGRVHIVRVLNQYHMGLPYAWGAIRNTKEASGVLAYDLFKSRFQ